MPSLLLRNRTALLQGLFTPIPEQGPGRLQVVVPPRSRRGRHPEEPLSPAAFGAFKRDLRTGVVKLVKRSSDSHMRVVFLVILLGAFLRIAGIGQAITHNEALSYTQFASRSYHTVFTDLAYPVNHVLHTALMRLSASLFGVHLWSIRIPALVAGILVMPVFYAFVRSMFNRYIALMALALVAGSGCLIEQSATAQGYTIVGLCYVCALMLGRHLVRTNNIVTAVLLGVVLALGMWTVPTTLYIAVAVYVWVFIQLSVKYRESLNRRSGMLLFSGLLFLALVVLLYLPIISSYGIVALFHHPAAGESNWTLFMDTHQDRAADLWAYFNGTAATWISLVGMVGLLFAAYISSKFRLLLFSVVLGSVPLVTLVARVGPPEEWSHLLFLLHLSSAIALFYLLKLIQERVYSGFAKRLRTVLTTFLLLAGMGYLGMRGISDRQERFPEAIYAANWFKGILHPDDRVLVEFPWQAPLEFHLLAEGLGREALSTDPLKAKAFYVLVGPADGQTLKDVLARHRYEGADPKALQKMKDWRRLEIYGVP